MKLDDLKEEHVVYIVSLYEQHCGWGRTFEDILFADPILALKRIKEDVSRSGTAEYRIGSKWDANSKLYFESDRSGLCVRFNSNFDPRQRKGKEYSAAERAGSLFVKAAMEYLNKEK